MQRAVAVACDGAHTAVVGAARPSPPLPLSLVLRLAMLAVAGGCAQPVAEAADAVQVDAQAAAEIVADSVAEAVAPAIDATVNCDDDDPCTVDVGSVGGCIHSAALPGTACGADPDNCSYGYCDAFGTCKWTTADNTVCDKEGSCLRKDCSSGLPCQFKMAGNGAVCKLGPNSTQCNRGYCWNDGACHTAKAANDGCSSPLSANPCWSTSCDAEDRCVAQAKTGAYCQPLGPPVPCQIGQCTAAGVCGTVATTGELCTLADAKIGVCSSKGSCVPKKGFPCGPQQLPCAAMQTDGEGGCVKTILTGASCVMPIG